MADEAIEVLHSTTNWKGNEIEVKAIEFSPFVDDAYLGGKPEYRNTQITMQFSQEVPGGVLALEVDAKNDGQTTFNRRLVVSP